MSQPVQIRLKKTPDLLKTKHIQPLTSRMFRVFCDTRDGGRVAPAPSFIKFRQHHPAAFTSEPFNSAADPSSGIAVKTAFRWKFVSGVEAWIGNWVARRSLFEKLSFNGAFRNYCNHTRTRCEAYMADGSLLYSILPARYSPVACSEIDMCHFTLHEYEIFDGRDMREQWYAALN